jgi:hypothetical protein
MHRSPMSRVKRLVRRHGLPVVLGLALTAGRAGAQIRVIVHPATPDTSITMRELARLFRGEYSSLPGGDRVRLVEHTAARAAFYQGVVQMSGDQFRRHWIRVVFAGNPVTPPEGFESVADAVRFVATHRGALAFVNGPVDATVKVLLIDGRAPGDPAYRLR